MPSTRELRFRRYARLLFVIHYESHKGNYNRVAQFQHLALLLKQILIRDYTRTFVKNWFDIINPIIQRKALQAYARDRGYHNA